MSEQSYPCDFCNQSASWEVDVTGPGVRLAHAVCTGHKTKLQSQYAGYTFKIRRR